MKVKLFLLFAFVFVRENYASTLCRNLRIGLFSKLTIESKATRDTSLCYDSYTDLTKQVEDEGSLKMWSLSKIDQEKKLKPSGGYLVLIVERDSVESVAVERFTLLILKNGKKIQESQGVGKSYTDYSDGTWKNIIMFTPEQALSSDAKLFIVDDFRKERYEYSLSAEK